MPTIPIAYDSILTQVEKPGRYVGGELNAVVKDPARIRASIALAFPDLYDLGMSYHGFRILYERVNNSPDFAAERVYTPWVDFADALRQVQLPLYSLETYRPLADFEIIGFTLQHELNYTNVLEMLDLARIPLRSADRTDTFPLVIAGGEGAYSPEPMAPFIDAFAIGDGEEIIFDLLEAAAEARKKGTSRADLLRTIAKIPGVYVPSLYNVTYHADGCIQAIAPVDSSVPATIRPREFNIASDLIPVQPVVPLIRTVQDRSVIEIRRGCVNGCRFCQAGMITRPVRERPVEQVVEIAEQQISHTGDDEIALLSLSTADYTEISRLVHTLSGQFSQRRISVALPSLRISSFDVELASQISSVRKSGFTFAPEAGSEALRQTINKPLDEAEFINIIGQVLKAGWRTIKMYFMIGLPGETDADLDGIVRIVRQALDRARSLDMRNVLINVTLSPFVPKSHTPFQWEGRISRDEVKRRLNYIRDHMPRKGVGIKTSPIESSVLEAVVAKGDRRMADVIEVAWKRGCRFDAWRETFLPDVWWDAFASVGLDPAWYSERQRDDDEVFPYDHIESGPGKAFLVRQRDLARAGATTPDCINNACCGCAACDPPKQHQLARDEKVDSASPTIDEKPQEVKSNIIVPEESPAPNVDPPRAVQRIRVRFSKSGPLRFIAHLDLAELIHRLVRMTGAPLAHSHGFNPQPQISTSPPLPLGFEGAGELLDIRLLERIEIAPWLEKLRTMPVQGLQWMDAWEVPLEEDSLQQAIPRFDYRIEWNNSQNDPASIRQTLDRFMQASEWLIEIDRKGKVQQRDARGYVLDIKFTDPSEGHDQAMEMAIASREGMTLNPLVILSNVLGESFNTLEALRFTRLPLTP